MEHLTGYFHEWRYVRDEITSIFRRKRKKKYLFHAFIASFKVILDVFKMNFPTEPQIHVPCGGAGIYHKYFDVTVLT